MSAASEPPPLRPVIGVDARVLRRPHIGVSTYLTGLVRDLLAVGEVMLVTSSAGHAQRLQEQFPACGVDVISDRHQVSWEQAGVSRWLNRARPSVYIAGANRGLPLRRPQGVRMGLVVHDLIPLRMPRTYLTPDPFFAFRYLLGTAVSLTRADFVIANSQSTADDVRRLLRKRPIFVRYPEVPGGAENAASEAPWRDWPDQFFLFCGGSDARKNADVLIRAHAEYWHRGGRVPLILMGGGFDYVMQRLGDPARYPHAHFVGLLDDGAKWWAIRNAIAVVYPSSWEGFGFPIVEALSVGTPVVAGRGGGQTEAGGNATLYVDGLDESEIIGALFAVNEPEWQRSARVIGPEQISALYGRTPAPSEWLPALIQGRESGE